MTVSVGRLARRLRWLWPANGAAIVLATEARRISSLRAASLERPLRVYVCACVSRSDDIMMIIGLGAGKG